MSNQQNRKAPQVTAGVLTIAIVGAAAVLLGWLASELAVRLVDTFEVVAVIVGWILWPFRL